MKYRIYANIQGWQQTAIKSNIEDTLKVVEDMLAIDIHDFIVIEHDNKLNIDNPIITNESTYNSYKEKYSEKVKKLGK